MFYRGDIVRFQELPEPKLNWYKKLFYKYKKPYVSYYVRNGNTLNKNEHRILLKNNDFFKVEYRNINMLLLTKLGVISFFDYCELGELEYIVDPYLQYNGKLENFVIASKEDMKRMERKQKLERINENRINE